MRPIALLLVFAGACGGSAAVDDTQTLSYTIVSSGRNAEPCVAGPEFRVALDEDGWIDIYDAQTGCVDDGEIHLPNVRFPARIGIAAWWAIDPCPGRDLEIREVKRQGDEIVVAAEIVDAAPGPCEGMVGLESILNVQRPEAAVTTVRFLLGGRTLGSVALA